MRRALQFREIGGNYDLHTPLAQGPLREPIVQDIKANPAGWTTGHWQICLTRRNTAAAGTPNVRAVRDAPFAIVLLVDGGEGSSGAADPAGTAAGKPVAWLRLRRNDSMATNGQPSAFRISPSRCRWTTSPRAKPTSVPGTALGYGSDPSWREAPD